MSYMPTRSARRDPRAADGSEEDRYWHPWRYPPKSKPAGLGCLPCVALLAGFEDVDPAIFTAAHNAREVAKHLILLEDHLGQPSRNCQDCVAKHRLAAEAFAEEALGLDGADQMPWLAQLGPAIRGASSRADVRAVRKELVARIGGSGGRLSGLGGVLDSLPLGAILGLGAAAFSLWHLSGAPDMPRRRR